MRRMWMHSALAAIVGTAAAQAVAGTLYGAAHGASQGSTALWALESFVQMRDPSGKMTQVELRRHCCHTVAHAAAAVCAEYALPLVECTRLEQFVETNSHLDSTVCNCGTTAPGRLQTETTGVAQRLGTLALEIVRSDENRVENLRLVVHAGDVEHVDTRVDSICKRFRVDREACSRFRAMYRKHVVELELEGVKKRVLETAHLGNASAPQQSAALVAFERIVISLEARAAELERVVEEKALAFRRLYWQSVAERHELERHIRRLEREVKQSRNHERAVRIAQEAPPKFSSALIGNDASSLSAPATDAHFMDGTTRIPRVSISNFTYEQYLNMARSAIPIILQGFAEAPHSPGLPPWTLSHLSAVCGDKVVSLKKHSPPDERSGSVNGSVATGMWAGIRAVTKARLADFLRDFARSNSTTSGWPKSYADLYLHDMSVPQTCPELLHFFHVPRFFSDDKLQLLTVSPQRNYWPSLFIGDKSTTSALHADWGRTAAWMGLLRGRKHWVIAKPSSKASLHELIPTDETPSEGRFAADLLEPKRSMALLRPGEVFEDILEAGEVLFIPADCPHQVRNLDKTIAVAANFVDSANVVQFIDDMRRRGDSAVRDEDRYYRTMLKQLQQSGHPIATTPRDASYHEFKAQAAGTWP